MKTFFFSDRWQISFPPETLKLGRSFPSAFMISVFTLRWNAENRVFDFLFCTLGTNWIFTVEGLKVVTKQRRGWTKKTKPKQNKKEKEIDSDDFKHFIKILQDISDFLGF